MGSMQPTSAVSSADRRFTGVIKSFNAEKGYGFIESAEAYSFYQRDVFLHKALIGNLSVGATVTFTVEVNKEGMPQARDIKGTGGTSGGGKGKGKGKGRKGEVLSICSSHLGYSKSYQNIRRLRWPGALISCRVSAHLTFR